MEYQLKLYIVNCDQSTQKVMDNFFAKKGLILGRKKQTKTSSNQQQLLRSNELINNAVSQIIHQDRGNHQHIWSSNQEIPFLSPKKENTNSSLSTKYQQKSFSLQHNNKMVQNKNAISLFPSPQKHQPWKQIYPFINLKQQDYKQHFHHFNQQINCQTNNIQVNPKRINQSFEEKRPETEKYIRTSLIYQDNEPNKVNTNIGNKHRQLMKKISVQLQSDQGYTLSPKKQNISKIQELMYREDIRNQIIEIPHEQYYDFSFHCEEKQYELNTADNLQRQDKFNKQVLKDEIKQIKKPEQQITTLLSERLNNVNKIQKTRQCAFFQEDCNNQKDYNNLKKQLQNALAQNQAMFQDHQKYIVQVGQIRKQFERQIAQLQGQVQILRGQYKDISYKIEQVTQKGDDKMKLIKLQNQNNFLRKKTQEQIQKILAKQEQLSETKLLLHSLHEENSKRQSSLSFRRDELNLQQIKQSLASYEIRIQQLNSNIDKKQQQIYKHKKSIQNLEGQIRRLHQQIYISSIKQKSNENNLKNEIDTLAKSLSNQIQMSDKRILNLEDAYQRRGKEIADKDKFIQQFLISRAKQLNNSTTDEIMSNLKAYFSFKTNIYE